MTTALQTQPPHVSFLALFKTAGRAAGRVLLAQLGLDAIPETLADFEREKCAERLAYWSRAIKGENGDTSEAFAQKLAAALQGADGSIVRTAVLESARAAVDAVDDASVFYIGRLTNRFLVTKTPELWRFRKLLGVLQVLDAEMLDAMRAAIIAIAEMGVGPSGVGTAFEGEPSSPVWVAETTFFGGSNSQVADTRRTELYRGEVVRRLALTLSGSVGMFSGHSPLVYPHFMPEDVELLRWLIADA